MPSCLLNTTVSVHLFLPGNEQLPSLSPLSSVQHSITLWVSQSLKGWSHTSWALAKPATPALCRAALLAHCQLRMPSQTPDIRGTRPLDHYGVSMLSPLVPVSSQHSNARTWKPVFRMLGLDTPTLWLVMLCRRTDFSGGQRYLVLVKRSVHECCLIFCLLMFAFFCSFSCKQVMLL